MSTVKLVTWCGCTRYFRNQEIPSFVLVPADFNTETGESKQRRFKFSEVIVEEVDGKKENVYVYFEESTTE